MTKREDPKTLVQPLAKVEKESQPTKLGPEEINTEVSLITEVDGEPMVDSGMIAEMFDRPHKDVMRSIKDLISKGDIDEREFAPIQYIDKLNRSKPMYLLTETAALVAMPYIEGKKSREGHRKLVTEYLDYRSKVQAMQVAPKTPETKLEWMKEAIAAEEGRLLALEEKAIAEKAKEGGNYPSPLITTCLEP